MTRDEFVSEVAKRAKEKGVGKKLKTPKTTFTITNDSDGEKKSFTVSGNTRHASYSIDDIADVANVMIEVISDALARGEQVNIRGFGTFSVAYHKPKVMRSYQTGELITIGNEYRAKFRVGNELKRAAALYTGIVVDKLLSGGATCEAGKYQGYDDDDTKEYAEEVSTNEH